MIALELYRRDPAVCPTLFEAAKLLLRENAHMNPVVSVNGEVVIEMEFRYIPGDCYEPSGYRATTPDAVLALAMAEALQRMNLRINMAAFRADREIHEQTVHACRMLRRRLFTGRGNVRKLPGCV